MKLFFKRLPGRRLELALASGLPMIFGLMAWLFRSDPRAAQVMVFTLEILLPVLAAIAAAGMLAGDPGLELLLTSPHPPRRTCWERILRLWLLSGVAALALVSIAAAGEIALPVHGLDTIFIWLPPLVFLSGLGSLAALLRGRLLAGALAVSSFALAGYFAGRWINGLCAIAGAGIACPYSLAIPFTTLSRPFDPYWPLNRLVWTALGALLLFLALRLADREEILLNGLSSENAG